RLIPLRGPTSLRLRFWALMAGALGLGSGLMVLPMTQAAAASGCSINYTVANQWATGFTVQSIGITNLGDPLTSWKLEFDFPGNQVVQPSPWNGTFTQAGQHVTITNLSYNGTVATNGGGNPGPGFNGAYSGTNGAPSGFKLNGTACNGGTPTPTPTGTATPTPTPTNGTPTPTPTPTNGTPTPTPP